jgi:hypothetical protein
MTHVRDTMAAAAAAVRVGVMTVAADRVIAVIVTAADGSVETVENEIEAVIGVIEVVILLVLVVVMLWVVAVYWTILASSTNRYVYVMLLLHIHLCTLFSSIYVCCRAVA